MRHTPSRLAELTTNILALAYVAFSLMLAVTAIVTNRPLYMVVAAIVAIVAAALRVFSYARAKDGSARPAPPTLSGEATVSAFARVVIDPHLRTVQNFAYRLTGSRAITEQVAVQVMTTVWREFSKNPAAPLFQSDEALRPYLFSLASALSIAAMTDMAERTRPEGTSIPAYPGSEEEIQEQKRQIVESLHAVA